MAIPEHSGPEYLRSREDFARTVRRRIGTLVAMGASYSDAEEAVQDAVMRVWKSEEHGNDPEGYLFRATVTSLFKIWRRRTREQRAFEDITIGWNGTHTPSPEGRVLLSEAAEEGMRILRSLPPAQRETYVLRIEGMEYSEIAELTGRSEEALRQNMNRAKKAIEAIMKRNPMRRE